MSTPGDIRPSPELVAGPREGQREAVQAQALLEKAERLLETVQPEDRPEVERLMDKVRTAPDRPAVGEADGRDQRAGRRAVLPGGCVTSSGRYSRFMSDQQPPARAQKAWRFGQQRGVGRQGLA